MALVPSIALETLLFIVSYPFPGYRVRRGKPHNHIIPLIRHQYKFVCWYRAIPLAYKVYKCLLRAFFAREHGFYRYFNSFLVFHLNNPFRIGWHNIPFLKCSRTRKTRFQGWGMHRYWPPWNWALKALQLQGEFWVNVYICPVELLRLKSVAYTSI